MHLGRVCGSVVATVKAEGLSGVKMLIVQPLDRMLNAAGEPVVCCDGTGQAGPGDTVYFIGGREAAMALSETFVPVDHAITGIVDHVDDL
jgi:ethanolamine utilization protein EutN